MAHFVILTLLIHKHPSQSHKCFTSRRDIAIFFAQFILNTDEDDIYVPRRLPSRDASYGTLSYPQANSTQLISVTGVASSTDFGVQ